MKAKKLRLKFLRSFKYNSWFRAVGKRPADFCSGKPVALALFLLLRTTIFNASLCIKCHTHERKIYNGKIFVKLVIAKL